MAVSVGGAAGQPVAVRGGGTELGRGRRYGQQWLELLDRWLPDARRAAGAEQWQPVQQSCGAVVAAVASEIMQSLAATGPPVEMPPPLELQAQEVAALVDQLHDYHAIYSPLFQRREQRQHSADYLCGLLLDIPRKSIEPIGLALHGADRNAIRALQMFVSEGTWEDEPILHQHWQEVDATLGAEDGVLILDGSDFAKQGKESVGVKRQYCGTLGKRANCQAGVFLGYASDRGYTLLDRRLYLPEEWVTGEEYQERRQKCGVPDDVEFHTKPELGAQMVAEVVAQQTLRGRWLACDEGFGRDSTLLDEVAEQGLWYFAEVPHNTRVWRERPQLEVPPWSGRGRRPSRLRLSGGQPEAQAVSELAAAVPAQQWQRQEIKEGSKGPLVADFACLRVVAVRDGLPGPEVWLVLRRHLDSGEVKTFLSNAPATVGEQQLVRVSGMRWPIESCFEESKQHLGMDEYEVRSWRGWHHHMTLCLLAHLFLVRQQQEGVKRGLRG